MRVQHESCETLLLTSPNQKQAHTEYEIVNITSSQIALLLQVYIKTEKDEGQTRGGSLVTLPGIYILMDLHVPYIVSPHVMFVY